MKHTRILSKETPLSLRPVIVLGTNTDVTTLTEEMIAITVNTFSVVSVCPVRTYGINIAAETKGIAAR